MSQACGNKNVILHQFDNAGDSDAKALAVVTPGILGSGYFREVAAILDAAAGGPPDYAALGEVMQTTRTHVRRVTPQSRPSTRRDLRLPRAGPAVPCSAPPAASAQRLSPVLRFAVAWARRAAPTPICDWLRMKVRKSMITPFFSMVGC